MHLPTTKIHQENKCTILLAKMEAPRAAGKPSIWMYGIFSSQKNSKKERLRQHFVPNPCLEISLPTHYKAHYLHKLEENIDPAQLHKSKTVPRSVLYKIKLSVADATESCILDSNKLWKRKDKIIGNKLKNKIIRQRRTHQHIFSNFIRVHVNLNFTLG